MVKPGKKYNEAYVLSAPKGREILVIRSDDEYSQKAMIELDAKMHAENPEWNGMMLVMRTDQSIEKMSEAMAFALYQAHKKYFEPAATWIRLQDGVIVAELTADDFEKEIAALGFRRATPNTSAPEGVS